MRRFAVMVVLGAFVSGLCGCTCRIPVSNVKTYDPVTTAITLYARPMDLRLSKPSGPAQPNYLVVYATGDGGWWGLGHELFDWISRQGYPVVGFSSKSYLKNLGHVSETETTTPRRLTRDLQSMIAAAQKTLNLPDDTRIILVGISRGAGLAVVAAGQPELRSRLAGVIAMALTREEEHVVRYRRRRGEPRNGTNGRERVEIKTYEYLPRLASVPVSVIQSTHDHYLPAEAARRLFGPDTELRKFHAVPARNHSFRGGCAALRNELDASLRWIQKLDLMSALQAPPD